MRDEAVMRRRRHTNTRTFVSLTRAPLQTVKKKLLLYYDFKWLSLKRGYSSKGINRPNVLA